MRGVASLQSRFAGIKIKLNATKLQQELWKHRAYCFCAMNIEWPCDSQLTTEILLFANPHFFRDFEHVVSDSCVTRKDRANIKHSLGSLNSENSDDTAVLSAQKCKFLVFSFTLRDACFENRTLSPWYVTSYDPVPFQILSGLLGSLWCCWQPQFCVITRVLHFLIFYEIFQHFAPNSRLIITRRIDEGRESKATR